MQNHVVIHQAPQHQVPPGHDQRRIVKLTGVYHRSRTGCSTCRQRKKRCAGPRPRCDQCQRLNLRCVWEPERDVFGSSSQTSSFFKAPNPMQFWAEAIEDGPETLVWNRRTALRYYVQSFAPILSTTVSHNGFLNVLLPMATESETLLHTIVAWSSSHLALCQNDLKVNSLEDRSQALTSFRSAIADQTLSRDFIIAACLILCSMESILGDTMAWYSHLSGAALLIRETMVEKDGKIESSLQRTVEGRWLLRNYAYHDNLASVSLNKQTLIPGLYWLTEEGTVVDTYFGLASVPMARLADITSLRTQLEQVQLDDADDLSHGNERVFEIESSLIQWTPGDAQDRTLICLAESYRSAALIYLYRTLRYHRRGDANVLNQKIAQQVDAIMDSVSNMPTACLPECTLLFPLFMAGGEMHDIDQMKAVKDRMTDLRDYRRFENVKTGLDVLEEVWDVRSKMQPNDPARPYDWVNVLQRRNWKLALS